MSNSGSKGIIMFTVAREDEECLYECCHHWLGDGVESFDDLISGQA